MRSGGARRDLHEPPAFVAANVAIAVRFSLTVIAALSPPPPPEVNAAGGERRAGMGNHQRASDIIIEWCYARHVAEPRSEDWAAAIHRDIAGLG